jgi:Berberine and berberine like
VVAARVGAGGRLSGARVLGLRRDGELARAARIALWLSRQYALVWGNEAAPSGWLARAERLLTDVGTGAGYLNFLGREDEPLDAGVDEAHASNLRRLAEIKAVYDPDYLFRRNNNIAR